MFIMTFTADTAAASVLERVLAQAEAELNWPRSQVEASVIDVLTRDGCTFYGVRNKQQMDGPRYGYVALPDGSILGVREENRAERTLNMWPGSRFRMVGRRDCPSGKCRGAYW